MTINTICIEQLRGNTYITLDAVEESEVWLQTARVGLNPTSTSYSLWVASCKLLNLSVPRLSSIKCGW